MFQIDEYALAELGRQSDYPQVSEFELAEHAQRNGGFQLAELTLDDVATSGFYSSDQSPGGWPGDTGDTGNTGGGDPPDTEEEFHHSALSGAMLHDTPGADDGLLTLDPDTMYVGWSDQPENFEDEAGRMDGRKGFDSTDDASGYWASEMSTGSWDWANTQHLNSVNHDINQIYSHAATTSSGIAAVKAYLIDIGLGQLTSGARDASYNSSNGYRPTYTDSNGNIVVTGIGDSGHLSTVPSIISLGDRGAVTWSPPPPPGQATNPTPNIISVNLGDHSISINGHAIVVHDNVSNDPNSAGAIAKIDSALGLLSNGWDKIKDIAGVNINNMNKIVYTGQGGRSGIKSDGTFMISKSDIDGFSVMQLATSIVHDAYHMIQRQEGGYRGIHYDSAGHPKAGESMDRIVKLEQAATNLQITVATKLGAPQSLIDFFKDYAKPGNEQKIIDRFNEKVTK